MRKYFSKTLVALSFGFAGFLLAGCGKGKNHQQQQMPAPVVTVAPVEQQEIVEWDEFTGRTAAIENVEVRPRVSGHIEAVKFQSGTMFFPAVNYLQQCWLTLL